MMTVIRWTSRLVCVIACVAVAGAHASATYNSAEFCSADLCRNAAQPGQPPPTHSACTKRTGFDYSSCPRDTVALEMTPVRQAHIIELHNTFRNRIADGQLSGFEPSERMVEMEWCDKLAYVAACHANHCKFEHDKCRNTKEYTNSGQNIACVSQSGDYKDDDAAVDQMVKLWVDEAPACSMGIVRNFQMLGGPQIGHFTQLAHGSCNKVGCAGVKFRKECGDYSTMLMCNYAETNMLGQWGETASACQAGRSTRWTGLCCPDEVRFFPHRTPNAGSSSSASSRSSSSSSTISSRSVSAGPFRSFTSASSSSSLPTSGIIGPHFTGDPFQQLGADPFQSLRRQMQLQTLPTAMSVTPAGGTSVQISTRQTPTGVVTTRTSTDANGVTTTTVEERTGSSLASSSTSAGGLGGGAWPGNDFFNDFFSNNM